MKSLGQKVAATIQNHSLLEPRQTVVVALSGGSDSVAMLRILVATGYNCVAAHYNFHLRGDESMRDEHFVRKLCEELGVTLEFCEGDTRKIAKAGGQSIEMAARAMRYAFFAELSARYGAPVAVAHHRDDNAETLLLNLFRGTGLRGICGMDYKGRRTENGITFTVIRPMLDVSHSEILAYLDEIKQDYVTDSTNLIPDVKRNKIRLEVMPQLEALNPSVAETLQGNIRRFSMAYEVYRHAIGTALEKIAINVYGDEVLEENILNSCGCREAALFEWLSPKGFNGTQISEAAMPDSGELRVFENPTYLLYKDGGRFVLVARNSLPQEGEIEIKGMGTAMAGAQVFEISETLDFPPIEKLSNPMYAYIDAASVRFPLTLRAVRAGDRFVPFGMRGSKLVGDFLKDAKVPLERRLRQLVICDAEKILWICGLRTDNRARISGNTRRILRIKMYVK